MEAAKIGKKERKHLNRWIYCHHCGHFEYQWFKGTEKDWWGEHYVFHCGMCNEAIFIPRDTTAAVIDGSAAAA